MFLFQKLILKYFKQKITKQYQIMLIDLSAANEDVLTLILLRVPAKDLLNACTKISRKWNQILSENYFWRDKMDYDGYGLEWHKLVGISTKSLKLMAFKRCFERNFLNDYWALTVKNEHSLTLDPRWKTERILLQSENNIGGFYAQIEIPPKFLDEEPKIPPGFEEPIAACVATSFHSFSKKITIKLADEGLTNEIMDNFRPTIVVSEMVGNRRDNFNASYTMECLLKKDNKHYLSVDYPEEVKNLRSGIHSLKKEFCQKRKGHFVAKKVTLNFRQGQFEEGWYHAEIVFKDYPAKMRYLTLQCRASDGKHSASHYGVKMANCSVKALREMNAE